MLNRDYRRIIVIAFFIAEFYVLVTRFIKELIRPTHHDFIQAKREVILNTLLLGSIILSVIAITITSQPLTSLLFITGFIFFCVSYYLSKRGHAQLVSQTIVIFYYVGACYTALNSGVNIPESLLIDALLIFMSAILIGPRYAAAFTCIVIFSLLAIYYIQLNNIIYIADSINRQLPSSQETLIYGLTLCIIYLLSLLFNSHIEEAMKRAQRSTDRMEELYRFAEFGRLATGVFHDLINPLTVVSLNLRQMRNASDQYNSQSLDLALKGAERMEQYIDTAKKQLQNQTNVTKFLLNKEIENLISLFRYRLHKTNIKLTFHHQQKIMIYGDIIKLHQALTNILSNAIDAYSSSRKTNKQIDITLSKNNGLVNIMIKDYGNGIQSDHLQKIFEPMFTTKRASQGMGMGLFITKRIIEVNFQGKIEVHSNKKEGTIFTISLPTIPLDRSIPTPV